MRNRSGFTLVELLIVVLVIGILSSLAAPRMIGWARRTKEVEALPLLKQVYTLQERHHARTGSYTAELADLEGGDSLANGGKHYDLSVGAHATGYCTVATPNAEGVQDGLSGRSMDATGRIYENLSCS